MCSYSIWIDAEFEGARVHLGRLELCVEVEGVPETEAELLTFPDQVHRREI